MAKSAQDVLHDVDMLLITACNKLHDVHLMDKPEGLNAAMYSALVMAVKEMERMSKLTGHGCTETFNRVSAAICDYDRVQRAIYGEV